MLNEVLLVFIEPGTKLKRCEEFHLMVVLSQKLVIEPGKQPMLAHLKRTMFKFL